MLRPDYKEFSRLARESTLVAVVKSVTADWLAPVSAGAVGFCSYDIVRQLAHIGDCTKDDLQLPDCALMFFDRLLAFDHLRHQIHIIAAADVSHETPKKAYERAVTDIARLEKQL